MQRQRVYTQAFIVPGPPPYPSSSLSSPGPPRALAKQPPSRLICTICQEVFFNPVHLSSCSHCFCEMCIVEWISRSQNCPICREPTPQQTRKMLHKAHLIVEFLEELEVRCKFGVSMISNCQHFGIVGNEFENINEGCGVTLPLKDIKKHEEKCPYNSPHNSLKLTQLKEDYERLKNRVSSIQDQHEVTLTKLQEKVFKWKEKYNNAIVTPLENFNYQIDQALVFAKVLSYNMFDGNFDRNRCFLALQRLQDEWRRFNRDFDYEVGRDIHYLFYTASVCTFWSPKQQQRIDSWKEDLQCEEEEYNNHIARHGR